MHKILMRIFRRKELRDAKTQAYLDRLEADRQAAREAVTAKWEDHDWPDAPVGTYFWHIHHEALVEALDEPLTERINYILEYKPISEVDTRLELIKQVSPEMQAIGEARDAAYAAQEVTRAKPYAIYNAAYNAAEKLDPSYGPTFDKASRKARIAYDKAMKPYRDAVLAARNTFRDEGERLHAIECPNCPWDGYTIFPNG